MPVSSNIKTTIAIAGSVLALLTSLTGLTAYLGGTYVSKVELEASESLRAQQEEHMEEKFLDLAQKMLAGQNVLSKDIKDAKAYPLIVKRDILMSLTNPTPKEAAELRILDAKLDELNED